MSQQGAHMSCRKQFTTGAVFVALAAILLPETAWAITRITSVDFRGTVEPNQIEIHADSTITYEMQENPTDRQIVIEIKDAQLSTAASRKIDTSSFDSNVTLISPYQVQGQSNTVRVVVQLREPGTAELASDGNVLRLSVPNPGGQTRAAESPTAEQEVPPAPLAETSDIARSQPEPKPTGSSKLEEFMEGRTTQRFVGKPITLQVKDVEAADVFRMIGEASGFNIVLGDDVKGKVTLSLVDVPWDQALDVLLHTLHLGAERNGNILRIITLQNLTAEKTEELKASLAAQANTPRITRIFPISYASLPDLSAILSKFATTTGASPDTMVQVDNRTNSLIIRDIPDNIEKMRKLIEQLDTQTPQVLIEAKVVEASENFSKTLSGSLGLSGGRPTSGFASMAGANPIDPLVGTPGVFDDGNAVSSATVTGGGIGLGITPSLSFISNLRINALINMNENESQVKVVSSPKTVVLNKESASIVQGTPVLIAGTTTVPGVGTVPTTQMQSANLSLDVTPTVTNEGSVLMRLAVSKDNPVTIGTNSGIATRKITTLVLVDSGSTLVIGGIYSMRSENTSSGFPFLRKIPILGILFGNESGTTDRTELFIFITPRILNPKEAGLS
ncbi:MAG: hypothetical protein A2428_11540 [Bdellovibrionales bacterium RIFOXYC1_FULL_54_43]|nr:MAG: hypothetical protein A2428_11540 [Bdellovibrionales bacterium RIFOXYC1_FULL_54_43]OFZ79992.1 MAG: hypothetical protein A2603_02140 [Bdellovibrionales bacterium RIFOXYD1_FULL_55_31]